MRLYPTLSVESRRSACLGADALFDRGEAQSAANMIVGAWNQEQQAGDLGLLDPGDEPEMNWRAGRYLATAERYKDAIAFYSEPGLATTPRKSTKRSSHG